MKWTWSTAESELDFPRWASLCRQRDICPPVDALVAAYIGWERPRREIPVEIDHEKEDADFAAAMAGFESGDKSIFDLPNPNGSA